MSRRQAARARREEQFWAAKAAAARDGAARAAVAFDRVRARIAAAPARHRESSWAAVVVHLRALLDELDRQLPEKERT